MERIVQTATDWLNYMMVSNLNACISKCTKLLELGEYSLALCM